MSSIWVLSKKELRLLLRDPRAAVLLLGMPLLFILILGLLLGEGFGQNPDKRLRVSLVDLDEGLPAEYFTESYVKETAAWLASTPGSAPFGGRLFAAAVESRRFPPGKWSEVVIKDLQETAEIRLEPIPDRATAECLVRDSRRPAVLVFGPTFSQRMAACSFLSDGINPFYRDGVKINEVGAELLRDDTQAATSAVIEQVVQVSLLRVTLPWMIGKAFEKIGEEQFIERLGDEVRLPVPAGDNPLEDRFIKAKFAAKGIKIVDGKVTLNEALHAAAANRDTELDYRGRVGLGVQAALRQQFSKYDLTGKTWAALTKAQEQHTGPGAAVSNYVDEGGIGPLKRGAAVYKTLVPSYTVMFSFALILIVGWLFVSERRRGTLKRLRAAPLTRPQLLLGKFLPCLALAVAQGVFLLAAGKLAFGLGWGPDTWSLVGQAAMLLPVVVATALAAMGLAMLVAALARTEMQVAIYGAVLVLALGLVGGCVVPREMMPQAAQDVSQWTPNGWALNAYQQLMMRSDPNLSIVAASAAKLSLFGAACLGLAWQALRLD
jgi:ABC-type multidrug transport system permease subunit